ncbi:MAG: polyamine aminopropyltransferase [Pseudomonadota bacterium]
MSSDSLADAEPLIFTETICAGVEFSVRPDRVLFAGHTGLQAIHIFDHAVLGRVLALDHVVQTTESDEFIYHEMLVHVPMLWHGSARSVLVIGGGDGGTLREVLRHPVERAVMVELDADVVKYCRAHLPTLSAGAFDDRRTELVFGDGADYVRETPYRFDAIIIDSTDPIGPGKVLFEAEFFRACQACLNPGGVLVNQNGTPAFMPTALAASAAALRQVFAHTGFYYVPVPTYVSGVMALGWASDRSDLARVQPDILAARQDALGLACRWYSPAVHQAALAEPPALRALHTRDCGT